MEEDRRFLGVSPELLRALGMTVVASGRVEAVAHDLLWDLGRDPGTRQVGSVLREIRRAAKHRLPAHARVSSEQIIEWTRQVDKTLVRRHVPLHSWPVRKGAGEVFQHIRSRALLDADAAEVAEVARSLARLASAGLKLHFAILRSPKEGVYVRNVTRPAEPWVFIDAQGQKDFPRPSDEEIAAWWEAMGDYTFPDR